MPPLRLRSTLRRLASLAWYREWFAGLDLERVSWQDLPTMTPQNLSEAMAARPPDGGFRHPDVVRILSGPVPVPLTTRDLDLAAPVVAMALRRAGVSSDLAVELCLPFDGGGAGWWLVDALAYLGCRVWPAGAEAAAGRGQLAILPGQAPGATGELTAGPPDADLWLHPLGGLLAARCSTGGRVHPLDELTTVETPDGELVVSNLDRQALPTVRLRTGWPASLVERSCPCGALHYLEGTR